MSKKKGSTATTEPPLVEQRDMVQITSAAFSKLSPEAQQIIRQSTVARPALANYGQLREALAKGKYRWSTLRLPDETPLPRYSLGGKRDGLLEAAKAPRVDVSKVVAAAPPANPLLLDHLISLKILPPEAAPSGPNRTCSSWPGVATMIATTSATFVTTVTAGTTSAIPAAAATKRRGFTRRPEPC